MVVKRHERNIRRYEHNYFYGWVVSIMRAGRRWVAYFCDGLGGRMAALRQAREHRDKLLAALPRPTKIKRTYVRNTTGVIGVARVEERTRAGNIMVRYVASLPRRKGRAGKASFSIGLYGEAQAKRLAIRARRQALAEFLE